MPKDSCRIMPLAHVGANVASDAIAQRRFFRPDALLTRCNRDLHVRGSFQAELSTTGSQAEGFAKIASAQRRTMPKKIDPLNKKQYSSVAALLTVDDVKAAVSFYQKAFGFAKRGIMNGPDG